MEPAMGSTHPRLVADLHVVVHLRHVPLELGEVVRAQGRHGDANRHGLERDSHDVELLCIVAGQLRDPDPPVGFGDHEAFALAHAQRLRLPVAIGALGLAMALAACGGSSSSSSTEASGAATSNSTNSSTAADLSQATAIYTKFIGGSAGKADTSKPPIVIGFVNDEG